jgi:hypothetical protein
MSSFPNARFSGVRYLIFLLFFVCFFVFAASAQSPDKKEASTRYTAQIKPGITVAVDLAGSPQLIEKEGAKPTLLKKGEKIPVGGTVLTKAGDRVDLAMSNGALMQIQENSKFIVGEFLQDSYEFVFTNGAVLLPRDVEKFGADKAALMTLNASEEKWNELHSEPTMSKSKFVLEEGTMVANSKKLRPGSNMDIVTPIGTAGIRGTTWRLSVTRIGNSENFKGSLEVSEGNVVFTKPDGSGSVSVAGGFRLDFAAIVTGKNTVNFTALSTTKMSPEIVQALLSMVVEVAGRQNYFTAIQGTPEILASATNYDSIQGDAAETFDTNLGDTTQKEKVEPAPDLNPNSNPTPAPTSTPTPTSTPPRPISNG